MFAMLEHFKVREQIVRWMEHARGARAAGEKRGEHERVWGEFVKLFDEMVDLFADEPITLEDFGAILDSALSGFDLALTPPTVDQVLVGPVDRTRTPRLKACVVLGLSEGQFPRYLREGAVLTDSDRRILIQKDIDLTPETEQQLLNEEFLGYIAFTRAGGRLLLTRPASDHENRPVGPSILWTRIQRLFPDLRPQTPGREQELGLEKISTPRQLLTSLMQHVRADAVDDDWKAVYQWLSEPKSGNDDIDHVRNRAWKALSYRNDAKLDPDRASRMFPAPLNASMSGNWKALSAAPYQHFARSGLSLTPREKRQVSGADLSAIYHDVLDHLLRNL